MSRNRLSFPLFSTCALSTCTFSVHASTRLSRAFRLRLLTALAGYTRERFFKDAGSGLTAGIVALPLATAFAVASGLKPQAGIWTAIIAGALISALGGSAVPMGGPAGAFIFHGARHPGRCGRVKLLIFTARGDDGDDGVCARRRVNFRPFLKPDLTRGDDGACIARCGSVFCFLMVSAPPGRISRRRQRGFSIS